MKASEHIAGWLREAYFGQLLEGHVHAIRVFDAFPLTRPDGSVLENAAVGPGQRERVEDADRVHMPLEELAEIRFAQPAGDVLARLHRDDGRNGAGVRDAAREVRLAAASLAGHGL